MIHPSFAGYSVSYSSQAKKYLAKLSPKEFEDINAKIDDLITDKPNLNLKKLSMSKCDLYRLSVGQYRVVYSIEYKRLLVHIVAVGPRKDIYEKLYKMFGLMATVFLHG